jgi:hypothetical protein
VVGDQREVGIAGGDERDRDEVDPKVRGEAAGVEGRWRQFEVARSRKQQRSGENQRDQHDRWGGQNRERGAIIMAEKTALR